MGLRGTPNIEVVSHIPLPGERFSHADIEQELHRPFVYIAQRGGATGFYAISLEDEKRPKVLYCYIVDDPDLHLGSGCIDPIKVRQAD